MTTEERDIFADTSKDDISPSEKHIENLRLSVRQE
ncbi:hypothetical protein PGS_00007930 [Porphyromonas gingivalis A7A1-28]|nr:hypothetical protein PGS_00007930 [Porphyromonas gingivalis A7A1-28]